MATYAQAIAGARVLIGDSSSVAQRYTDATLLGFAVSGIYEVAGLRHDLFKVDGQLNCTANVIAQALPTPARQLHLIDLYEAINGGVATPIEECDLETLRRFRATWRSDAAAAAQNWMRYPADDGKRDEAAFMVYPKALTGQILTGCWVEVPDLSAVTVGTALPFSDDYLPAMENYVAYRAEMVNDESVLKARANELYANFRVLLGLSEAEGEAKA